MTVELLNKELKLKTFSIHENELSVVKNIKTFLFQYKHLENVLNLLLKQQFEFNQSLKKNINTEDEKLILDHGKKAFSFLLNPIIMKAVLGHTLGGIKTRENVAFINDYFKNYNLFEQAKEVCLPLNSHNISMLIRRLKKDWSNFFSALKQYKLNPNSFLGVPYYPKAKKLSKVYNYSLPLETTKFSLNKSGYLGINLGKKMFYVYIGHSFYFADKEVNNLTIAYSHGHIYYNFTYILKTQIMSLKDNKNVVIENIKKEAGGDIGINNILSLFINDQDTRSLVISGKELISYNCNFNKRLAKINTLISNQIKTYKDIIDKNNIVRKVPESYTNLGKVLINRKSQLFERRKLFFNDYMQKLSKKAIQYLSSVNVTDLVLSKNLSFTKTDGTIKMNKKTKQKFYQIPFGQFLNLIESKAEEKLINIHWIDEAYTSKTSSISSEVVQAQKLSKLDKSLITPNDLNGNRGVKKAKNLNNKLGRGLFKDNVINKILNADLNAACNHIKVAFEDIDKNVISKMKLFKWCNPIKLKSNHEFDELLKYMKIKVNNNQIVDIHLKNDNNEVIYYLS